MAKFGRGISVFSERFFNHLRPKKTNWRNNIIHNVTKCGRDTANLIKFVNVGKCFINQLRGGARRPARQQGCRVFFAAPSRREERPGRFRPSCEAPVGAVPGFLVSPFARKGAVFSTDVFVNLRQNAERLRQIVSYEVIGSQ